VSDEPRGGPACRRTRAARRDRELPSTGRPRARLEKRDPRHVRGNEAPARDRTGAAADTRRVRTCRPRPGRGRVRARSLRCRVRVSARSAPDTERGGPVDRFLDMSPHWSAVHRCRRCALLGRRRLLRRRPCPAALRGDLLLLRAQLARDHAQPRSRSRNELPRAGDARDGGGRRRRRRCDLRGGGGVRGVGARRAAARHLRDLGCSALGLLRLATPPDVLAPEHPRTPLLRRKRVGDARPVPAEPEHRQCPDRALSRCPRPGGVHARLQHHPRPVQPAHVAAARGVVSGVRAPTIGHCQARLPLASVGQAGGGGGAPVDAHPDRNCARRRQRRLRQSLVRGRAGRADPRLGRDAVRSSGPQLDRPPGNRPDPDALPVRAHLVCGRARLVRDRTHLGDRRRGSLLRRRQHARAAVVPEVNRALARNRCP
jgi:hypothetical protein